MNKTKPIPKTVRHAIYVKALDIYNNIIADVKERGSIMISGICNTIHYSIINPSNTNIPFIKNNILIKGYTYLINEDYNPYTSMKMFPEIAKYTPIDSKAYWFPLNDTASRIAIFEEAIELTKVSKRKQ